MISISFVIPLYNEEKNLPILFSSLEHHIAIHKDFAFEVVFVNDGSVDGTDVLLQDFIERHKEFVKVISYKKNKGKGFAVRTGMLEAQGDWRIIMDADLSVSLDEMSKIFPYMECGCPIIIGSRTIKGSLIEVPQGRARSLLGSGFVFLAKNITKVGVSDFTCGFKCFSREASELIFPLGRINRWSYDAEILYIAKKHALKICEIPVIWKNGPETKVRFGQDIPQSLFDLLRIILIHR